MSEHTDIISLQFHHASSPIPQTVDGIISKLKMHPLFSSVAGSVILKVRWILAELLTNAVKHSGVVSSKIRISLSEGQIQITKEDDGQPLPYFDASTDRGETKTTKIYQNGPEALIAAVRGHVINFLIEQKTVSEFSGDRDEISEHFGLMIITKACMHFCYEYFPSEQKNIFICKLSLES